MLRPLDVFRLLSVVVITFLLVMCQCLGRARMVEQERLFETQVSAAAAHVGPEWELVCVFGSTRGQVVPTCPDYLVPRP